MMTPPDTPTLDSLIEIIVRDAKSKKQRRVAQQIAEEFAALKAYPSVLLLSIYQNA